ncbi:MAG: mevalonate kinase [Planctomycetota bacterium]|jgi:mevalonate kinase
MSPSACGKAILLGEHAVVHGVPALSVPVSARRVAASCTASNSLDGIVIEGEGGGQPLDPRSHEIVRKMARLALDLAAPEGDHARGARVTLRSDLPIGAGLGSSAAVAVALVRAVRGGARLSDDEVARRANELEKLAHGTPSGIDAATVAHERALRFVRGEGVRFLDVQLPARLVVALIPREGTTATLVAGVAALKEAGDPRFDAFLRDTRAIVDEATSLLEFAGAPGDTDSRERATVRLGELMHAAHLALATVGVSTDTQDELCRALEAAGALGAKLSGAGGGGATIALLSAEENAPLERNVLDAALAAGATDVFVTPIGPRAATTTGGSLA